MPKLLSETPLIHVDAEVVDSELGRYTEVGARTSFTQSKLGDYSYIVNDGDVIYTTIGKFCSIAAHVRLCPGMHPMHRASQAHFTYRASNYWSGEEDDAEYFAWRRSNPVVIGHDVWIGHGVIVLPGVFIGTGAVLGAGAVVTKDVGNYEVVVGVPAKPIKRRFPKEIEARLIALSWWDWSHEKLQRALPDFRNLKIEDFLVRYER